LLVLSQTSLKSGKKSTPRLTKARQLAPKLQRSIKRGGDQAVLAIDIGFIEKILGTPHAGTQSASISIPVAILEAISDPDGGQTTPPDSCLCRAGWTLPPPLKIRRPEGN
jgi:hypothetical protein